MPSEPPSLLVGAIAAQVIGGLITQMSPLVIDGLMHGLSLSERDAGFVSSVEFLALALTAIAVAPVLPRASSRRIGFVAVALALLADGASSNSLIRACRKLYADASTGSLSPCDSPQVIRLPGGVIDPLAISARPQSASSMKSRGRAPSSHAPRRTPPDWRATRLAARG